MLEPRNCDKGDSYKAKQCIKYINALSCISSPYFYSATKSSFRWKFTQKFLWFPHDTSYFVVIFYQCKLCTRGRDVRNKTKGFEKKIQYNPNWNYSDSKQPVSLKTARTSRKNSCIGCSPKTQRGIVSTVPLRLPKSGIFVYQKKMCYFLCLCEWPVNEKLLSTWSDRVALWHAIDRKSLYIGVIWYRPNMSGMLCTGIRAV